MSKTDARDFSVTTQSPVSGDTAFAVPRRTFIVAAGLSGFAVASHSSSASSSGAVLSGAAAAATAGRDPRRSNAGLIKLLGSLDGRPAPWWFTGTIYGVQLGRAPVPMVVCEGCEVYFPRRLPNGDYLLRGNTLTFFRDVRSRQWLDEFANPLTGRRSAIRPNVLESGPESGFLYPQDGSGSYFVGNMGNTGQLNFKPPAPDASQPRGEFRWEESGEQIFATTSRSIATPAQPWLEISTNFVPAKAFLDPDVASAPAHGTVSYLSPWLKWMAMDEVPGHLLWHCGAHKLASLEALPTEYRQRAMQLGLMGVLGGPKPAGGPAT
jgi:hypothetical protein